MSALATTTPRQAWRAARVPAAIALVVLVLAGWQAARSGAVRAGYLTIDGTRPQGARALARLVQDRGVDVERFVHVPAVAGTTVFIPVPELVNPGELAAVIGQDGYDVVVVDPPDGWLAAADAGLEVVRGDEEDTEVREPSCGFDVARTAGDIRIGGAAVEAPAATARCYPAGSASMLATFERGDSRIVVLATGEPLTNAHLDEEGNAALGLGLLSGQSRLAWVHPTVAELLAESGEDQRGLLDLLPDRIGVAALQLVIAFVVLALWRVRRLGPPVEEPLPVVVRAAEAVEGRARLYRGARARGRAAEALRAGARQRLARRLGLRPDSAPAAMADAVERAGGRGPVEPVLYGPAPSDDAALVRLASQLDQLEREVRRR